MNLVRNFNLFPSTVNLLNLERKYGDSLNHDDLYGVPQPKKKKKAVGFEEGASVSGAGNTLGFEDTHMQSMTQTSHTTKEMQSTHHSQMQKTAD